VIKKLGIQVFTLLRVWMRLVLGKKNLPNVDSLQEFFFPVGFGKFEIVVDFLE